MKPTKFELFIFFALLALIAIILFSSCGTVKPTQPVSDDWAAIQSWQYGALVEPEFDESIKLAEYDPKIDIPIIDVYGKGHWQQIQDEHSLHGLAVFRTECDHLFIQYSINPSFSSPCQKCGKSASECFNESLPKDDNLIEWHGYIIIDASDSLIIIKNQ